MVRVREDDYYVYEPCIVRLTPHENPIPAIPSRWIKWAGILRGQLEVINDSYRVLGSNSFEIPVDDLVEPYLCSPSCTIWTPLSTELPMQGCPQVNL